MSIKRNVITCIVALISALPLIGAVKLQVVSPQGVPLHEVVAGSPCLVEVVVTGGAKVTSKPMIEGLTKDQIIRERSSTHMFVTNGSQKSEQHLGYLVNFSKPGTYTLGPARIKTDQGTASRTLTSETLAITVQDAPKESQSSSKHQAAFARWKIAKEKLFVGETVPYSLRFYYTDPKTAQVGLQGTDQAEHLIFTQEQPRQTTEKIGSITYSVIELSGRVTPTKTGELALPRALFSYTQPDDNDSQRAQWGSRSVTVLSMFGGFAEPKQALAASVSLTIEPIPQAQHPVHGVGSIKKVTFTASITKAKQGDPITCTLTIEGAFEPTLLQVPELTHPDTLRVYPSNSKSSGTYPTITKSCEYILQSTESGKVTIPAQKFFFFNPQTKKFQTFTTKPIQLTITPNPQASYEPPVQQKQQESTKTEIAPTQETALSSPAPQPEKITLGWETWWTPPFWLFLLLLVLPVIWYFTRTFIIRFFKRYVIYRKQKRLLKQSSRKLQQALVEQNPHLFWQTLQTVAQELLPDAPSWTAPEVLTYLKEQGWSDDDCALWEQLWEQSSRATFFITDTHEQTELKKKSSMIIKRIEQTLVKPWHHFFS